MDLRQFEMFRMVAKTESFTRAGEKLYVSHSAISRQVKLLEDELRVSLFTRGKGGVSLTEPGQILLSHVNTIFTQLQHATDSMSRTSRGTAQRFNLGTGATALNFFLRPVIEKLKTRYPDASVRVRTGQWPLLVEDLRDGVIDAIVGCLPMPAEGREFVIRPLYREELVAVVGNHHPLARKGVLQPDELTEFPLIIFPRYTATRCILEELFLELKISPTIQMEVDNDESIGEVIDHDAGIAFLPKIRAIKDKIHFLRIAGHQVFRSIGLVSLRARQSSEHFAFLSTLCCEQAKSTYPSDCLCA